MLNNKYIFLKKKILIYGLGKSGISSYKFLKKQNKVYLYDDNKNIKIKKKLKSNQIINFFFDYIVISPGINIETCKLNKFLKKNLNKIVTDLDIFYSYYNKSKNITITGTNGKSTTAQIIYEILKKQKVDVRLVGNIGNPILLEKNITNSTVFVIEASSYQLEYSKIFKAKLAVILNISPDHLERHKTLKNYINAKFRIIKNQSKKDCAILNTNNIYIRKKLKTEKYLSKIIRINKLINPTYLKRLDNSYFLTEGNKENLSFVLKIIKIFKIKKNNILQVLNNFYGLKYRQQIIYKSKKLTIINDSKATSFSSSMSILKSIPNVYWIVGGLAKKGDKFLLFKKDCKNFKVYIFGKNQSIFKKKLKKITKIESFKDLKTLIKKVFFDIKNNKDQKHKTILFSPAAASFDSFKDFEERGKYFNKLIKQTYNV